MNKKIALSATAFMLAIGGAFASQSLLVKDAYTSKLDIPTQVENCQKRGTCDETANLCQIQIGGTPFQLYEDGVTCATPLNGVFVAIP